MPCLRLTADATAVLPDRCYGSNRPTPVIRSYRNRSVRRIRVSRTGAPQSGRWWPHPIGHNLPLSEQGNLPLEWPHCSGTWRTSYAHNWPLLTLNERPLDGRSGSCQKPESNGNNHAYERVYRHDEGW